ncbi:MAG TPA: hypothetical protein VK459_01195, partial [Polyangiaceae bacterium]|nr:hypothetical protein [Polyangiaceae bacterium]
VAVTLSPPEHAATQQETTNARYEYRRAWRMTEQFTPVCPRTAIGMLFVKMCGYGVQEPAI